MSEEFLTVKETAVFLKMGVSTLNRLIKDGKIPSYKIEGKRLFQKSEIIGWVKQHASGISSPTTPEDKDSANKILISLD